MTKTAGIVSRCGASRALAVVALTFLSGCGGVRWRPDLGGALRLAARENRMVVVAYWSGWNADCRRMEREVFRNGDVIAALRSTIPVRVNALFDRTFAKTYGLRRVPAFVILAPDGSVLRVSEGFLDEGSFRGIVESARFLM